MTLQSDVRAVFRSASTYFGAATDYRTKTTGTWSDWASTAIAEIKTFTARQEMDPMKGTVVKRQRAVAKLYDTTTTDAPVLRMGDQLRKDSLVWTVDEVLPAESASGVYRYALVRDIPLAAQADRGQLPIAEGGATNDAGGNVPSRFTAENVDAVTLFKGAMLHRTALGLKLASNDDADLAAIAVCLVATDVGDDAIAATENIVRFDDWTAIAGAAALTPGALYLLGTDGMITTVEPTLLGGALFRQIIGSAVTDTDLDLDIGQAVAL